MADSTSDDWQPPTLPAILSSYEGSRDEFRDLFTDEVLPDHAKHPTIREWFDQEAVRVADRMVKRGKFDPDQADRLARSDLLEFIVREIMKHG